MITNFVINPLSSTLIPELQAKINQKTKPLGSLGQLESLALHIGRVQNSLSPSIKKPTILIFAGDHGIVEAGVSAYPQTVTAQMVANFLAGGAAISVFARQHQIDLFIVDAGVNADLTPHPKLVNAKIGKATKNFLHQQAMSMEDCHKAIETGASLVLQHYENGCNCIGFGEMGIGNTSSAAAVMHCLTGLALKHCTGRGTGLNDEQLQHKVRILQNAINRAGSKKNPLEVLAGFGGFEIAMMTGAYLKAAELQMLILVDGFIASSALLVASKLYPHVLDYCVFSHVSSEMGHQALLQEFNARALLTLDLRLGEASAIALAFPLIQSAVLFLNEMASFEQAGVDSG
jgi:nicotinate-nucleotide--dimethylbenzimidazole phosphoribosyltransferase